jgi:hypothetical protein
MRRFHYFGASGFIITQNKNEFQVIEEEGSSEK